VIKGPQGFSGLGDQWHQQQKTKGKCAMMRITINVALALPLGQPGPEAAPHVFEANNAFAKTRQDCFLHDQVDVEVLRFATTR
jgi:hypothetical protein